jgi:hypothetical protein
MIAMPIGPQPSTSADSVRWIADLFTACSPTAIGSVSAACRGSSPLGMGVNSGADSSIRSAYPPIVLLEYTIGSIPVVDTRTGSDVTSVPVAGASVSGPASSTSAANS